MTAAMTTARNLHEWKGELPRVSSDEQKNNYHALNRVRYSITDDDWGKKVRAFRELFNLSLPTELTMLSPQDKMLHTSMLLSELSEFSAASEPIEALDGLLDIIYVALGAALHMGFSPQQLLLAMEEIHAANMTKVLDNGRPLINDGEIDPTQPVGKVLKTNNYVKPSIAEAIAGPAGDAPDA